jgi:hypothetical protein
VRGVRQVYAEPEPLGAFVERISPDAEFDFTVAYPDHQRLGL